MLWRSCGAWAVCAAAAVATLVVGSNLGAGARSEECSADAICALDLPVTVTIEVTVVSAPIRQGRRQRLDLELAAIAEGAGWRPLRGRVRLSVPATEDVAPGNCLRVHARLRRPENFRNPGAFDYVAYLRRQGIAAVGSVPDSGRLARCGRAMGGFGGTAIALRREVTELIDGAVKGPAAGLLRALVVGDRSGISPAEREDFARAGVAHVLSVSGLHLGIVGGAAFGGARILLGRSPVLLARGLVPRLAAVSAVPAVAAYVVLAGARPPTARAAVMTVVFMLGVMLGRRNDLRCSIAAAVLAIGSLWPEAVFDVSFELSVVAVISIAVAMRWAGRREMRAREAGRRDDRGGSGAGAPNGRTPHHSRDDGSTGPSKLSGLMTLWGARAWRSGCGTFAVSVAATLGTAPLVALYFNQVSIVGLVANVFVVPVSAAATVIGLGGTAIGLVSPDLGRPLLVVAGTLLDGCAVVVGGVAARSFAAVRVVTPTVLEVCLAYLGLLSAVAWRSRWGRVLLLATVLVGSIDALYWARLRFRRPTLHVTFLDVGQGDAAVVEFPGSSVLVVDGGGFAGSSFDVGEGVVARFLWSRKIRRVDYVAMTHADFDHAGGLPFVVREFRPRELWWNGRESDAAVVARLMAAARAAGVRVRRLGDESTVWREGPVEVQVLGSGRGDAPGRSNDASLVLRLAWGATAILLAGDIERSAELDLLHRHRGRLAAAVLKVPHHGSRTSSSAAFLDAVKPRVAVVSVGRGNRYGFPHPEVSQRYATRGVCLRRTDDDGAVSIEGTANGYRVTPACIADDGPPSLERGRGGGYRETRRPGRTADAGGGGPAR
jgi:competence protein ComEC